jgi:SAM-dependent methyltransferase
LPIHLEHESIEISEFTMYETSKTKKLWSDFHFSLLCGNGIDIGCGGDLVVPNARIFDLKQGDANHITSYISGQFDFVYSSHCLEHMLDAKAAIQEWWQLVRPGGYLFIIVPDEDLYEQGFFPSRFNHDHKWTFTISKTRSWSPVSINLLELALSLPNSELVEIQLQDINYNRSLLKFGEKYPVAAKISKWLLKHYWWQQSYTNISWRWLESKYNMINVVDQTLGPDALAQIQCIVRKREP